MMIAAQCDGPSTTIHSSEDVTAISACGTYNGNIIIDRSATGQIALTGISHLKGGLTCNNATKLDKISFHQLVTISGSFSLQGLTVLSDLKFDSHMEVGDMKFIDLPALEALDFSTGIVTADKVTISDTALRDLSGLELSTCTTLDVHSNPDLTSIELNDLANTTDSISVSSNGPGLKLNLRSLAASRSITLEDVDACDVPLLETLISSLDLSQNTFRSFSAPSLGFVVDIAIIHNPLLSHLEFPLLPEISGD